jgi:hypothetical protein
MKRTICTFAGRRRLTVIANALNHCGSSAVGESFRPGEFASGTLVLRGRADGHRGGHVPLL